MIILLSCGALLTATSVSAAEDPEEGSSLLDWLIGADLGTVAQALPSVFCGNRLISYNSPTLNSPTTCVNGPVNSGNSTNSGNYHNEGNAINSGNFSNTNGSTGSSNNTNGGNTANGPQSVENG
ncbi:hypothetical protein ABGB18_42420 [Nonomuraea sp. B12E4]|uniref:hypothetical protein n=1 Tax=Nonomuraea sp. B12E4 TaxID=3153564 RepID=UPI00325E4C97